MPDDSLQPARNSLPVPGQPASAAVAPGPQRAGGQAEGEESHSTLSEAQIILRHLAGMGLVMAVGWGLIALVAFVGYRMFGPRMTIDAIGPVFAVVSFGLFYLLQKDLWLTRFLGIRVT